jgi:hypothetical protein
MRTLLATCLLAAVALAPSTGRARDFTLWIGGQSTQYFTGEVDPVVKSRQTGASTMRFGVEAWGGLNVEADWTHEMASASLFVSNRTTTAVDHVALAARYRLRLLSWLELYARAGGGLTTGALSLHDASGRTWTDRAWTGHVLGGLGIEVMIPRTVFHSAASTSKLRDFTVGFALEAGYRHAFGLDWSVSGGNPPAGVAGSQIDLGRLVLSGLTIAGAVTLHL